MKKTRKIIISTIAFLIFLPSLFNYAIYDGWLGVIGTGVSFLILTIMNRLNKKEFEINYNKKSESEKKLSDILKIILWVIIVVNFIISLYLIFYIGRIKDGVFIMMMSTFLTISSWRMP
ncbi:MAG: hypothetical protein Q7R87_01485 [Nanoarchaeota archaeon]|nr:hypothetical protein [Nanoarchaeota archaeon]